MNGANKLATRFRRVVAWLNRLDRVAPPSPARHRARLTARARTELKLVYAMAFVAFAVGYALTRWIWWVATSGSVCVGLFTVVRWHDDRRKTNGSKSCP